jgi:hypothetical protein
MKSALMASEFFKLPIPEHIINSDIAVNNDLTSLPSIYSLKGGLAGTDKDGTPYLAHNPKLDTRVIEHNQAMHAKALSTAKELAAKYGQLWDKAGYGKRIAEKEGINERTIRRYKQILRKTV